MQERPAVHLQTWVDDVSYDVRGADPIYVATQALQAYRTLQHHLTQAGLRLNTDETGFLTSSKEVGTALKGLLGPGDPSLFDVFRDLGIDATAAKRRRVTQIRKRFSSGSTKGDPDSQVEAPSHGRYRLHKGAIHPVVTWGAQAQGLAPQRRRQLRVMAGRGLKLQKSGSVDVVFDMNKRHPGPGDSIILQHVHTVWKIYHSLTANSISFAVAGTLHWAPCSRPNTSGKWPKDLFKRSKLTSWTMALIFKMGAVGTVQDMPFLTANCPRTYAARRFVKNSVGNVSCN